MLDLNVSYAVEYNNDCLKILHPTIWNDQTLWITHSFYDLKDRQSLFSVSNNKQNQYILNALLNNDIVQISSNINYHFLKKEDIQIIKNNQNNKFNKYYIYYTKIKDINKTVVIGYSQQKICEDCIEVNEIIYNTIKNIFDNNDFYGYINIIDMIDFDYNFLYFYLSKEDQKINSRELNKSEQINNISNVIFLSEPVYTYMKKYNENMLWTIFTDKVYFNIIDFMERYIMEFMTEENIHDHSIKYKKIQNIKNFIYDKNISCVFTLMKNNLLNMIYFKEVDIYIVDTWKYYTSLNYFSFLILPNKDEYILNYITTLSMSPIEKNNILPIILNETDLSKGFTFDKKEDLITYYSLDNSFFKLDILKNHKVKLSLNNINLNKQTCIQLLPYEGEKKLVKMKIITDRDYDNLEHSRYIFTTDTAMIEYIQHIESKNLIPIVSDNEYVLQNLNINSVMVITPEMSKLEEAKYILKEKIKQNFYQKYQNVDMIKFLIFVKTIQELSLYGICITILDSNTDLNIIKKQIDELTIPAHKKNKLNEYINMIEQTYSLYETMYKEYINIFDHVYIKLEQINTQEEYDELLHLLENDVYV